MSLAPDEIEVIRFALDDDSSVGLAEARTWLSADEIERAERYKFENLRHRYIRGRGMVRLRLASHLECPPEELRFRLGEHGKPFLDDDSLHFNLSHSEEVAALAISRFPDVGIDIEKFDRKVDFDGLAKRCFRDREWSQFSGVSKDEKVRAFFRIWTAKEARMKATGEGFQLSPQKIELGFVDGKPAVFREPVEPSAILETIDFPSSGTACAIAALRRFRIKIAS